QFTTVFADISIVVSQDDKAKIGLGVPAVGWTFHTLQSVHEPVPMTDHDFPAGSEQKSLGTSSHTYMQDLKSFILDPQYDDVLKTNGRYSTHLCDFGR
ncbi:4548_t:CDS:2, partial [Entrophospora sp. SA101]